MRSEPPDSAVGYPLLRAYWQELIDRYHGRPMPASVVDEEMAIDPSTGFAVFLVGFYDGTPAGCVGLRTSGALTRMYVAPEFRRRGGGRALLAAMDEAARELGFTRIRLDTRDDLVEARALYLACGYQEVAPFNAAPYAEHWFERRLQPRVDELPRSARRVRDALLALGLPADIKKLSDSTRTAPEAAAAVGVEQGAIVKSLVMRGVVTQRPLLVLVSGDNRADEALVSALIDEPIERPDAAYVREVTGYAIGGIPPVGHPAPVRTFMDEDLLRFETVWAAAGHPHAVFPVAPRTLAEAAGATVVKVSG